MQKSYLTLVAGYWPRAPAQIDAPLRTDLRSRRRAHRQGRARRQGGDNRIQAAAALRRAMPRCWRPRCTPAAPIRSACMRRTAGHPVAGDQKYGDTRFNAQLAELGLTRMFLHAHSISFEWPDGLRPELQCTAAGGPPAPARGDHCSCRARARHAELRQLVTELTQAARHGDQRQADQTRRVFADDAGKQADAQGPRCGIRRRSRTAARPRCSARSRLP